MAFMSRLRDPLHLVRAYAGTVFTQGLLLGFGILTGIFTARILGPAGRGELAAVTVWPGALISLAALGINQAIVYYTGKKIYTVSQVFSASLIVGIVQGLAVLLVGAVVLPLSLHNYSHAVLISGFVLLAASPALMLSGYPGNILQGSGMMGLFNLTRLASVVTYVVGLALIWWLHRATIFNVVVAQVAGIAIAVVVGYTLLFAKLKPGFDWKPEVATALARFGFKAQITNLTNYFNQRVDQLIMSLFVKPTELGLYVVGVTLATSVTFFTQAAGIVTLTRGSSQRHGSTQSVIGTSFRISLVWLAFGCAVLFLAAPWLITTVFGVRFAGSIVACRILLPGMVAIGLNQVLYNGASALGKPALPAYAEGAGMVVTAVGLALLLPRWGYIGAAVVSTTAYFVALAVMLHLLRTRAGFDLKVLFGGKPPEVPIVPEPETANPTAGSEPPTLL